MQATHYKGFSIIELLVVIVTIGAISLLATPRIHMVADRSDATATARDIKEFTEAIEFYNTANAHYPKAMSYNNMPEDIASYLPNLWKNGSYSWFYVHTDRFTYLYFYHLNFTTEQMVQLDHMIDDANIATGHLRMAYKCSGLIYLFRHTEGNVATGPR